MIHDHPNDNPSVPYRRTIHMPDMDSAFRVFQTHWRVTKPHWSRPLHEHPIFELNLVLDGGQDVLVGDAVHRMGTGDVLLIQPGVPHRVTGTHGRDVTYFAIHFDVEDYMFRAILSRYRCGHHPYGSRTEREIRGPLRDLIDLLKSYEGRDLSHPAPRLKLMSRAFDLFAALGGAEPSELLARGGRSDGFLAACRMADQIDKAVKSGGADADALDLRIAQLAEKLGYDRSYLCRVFRGTFGVSPRKYWSSVTLHHARLELMNDSQSMDRIAEKLGFRDGAHFSKQFKRWTGTSPTEYRQRQQTMFSAD
ncbi:helix-turn-helix domain-containing protein [Paenibacillus flagellatus]|uniref:helix-turn-helix domain-containing protein n=1 Tax=Paenibacillus flagellatus TaxID=2211139 RepID=UPI0013052A8D|nr:helix-turn-helix transcriptional regulator [Paenibacillus flagellatus]